MELNADFTLRSLGNSDTNPCDPSPMTGVAHKMLDRIGDEGARANTIVRFDTLDRTHVRVSTQK
ncbi:MAG: hypothetical protein AAGF44_07920 [Pseudomonadota bacterium]